jgi:hypothetical protein
MLWKDDFKPFLLGLPIISAILVFLLWFWWIDELWITYYIILMTGFISITRFIGIIILGGYKCLIKLLI